MKKSQKSKRHHWTVKLQHRKSNDNYSITVPRFIIEDMLGIEKGDKIRYKFEKGKLCLEVEEK